MHTWRPPICISGRSLICRRSRRFNWRSTLSPRSAEGWRLCPTVTSAWSFLPKNLPIQTWISAWRFAKLSIAAWGRATPEKPLILNLPATVERRPPNQYADMIELFCNQFSHPESVIISLHAHNDQGMAVAATELALLAGGQRVEGTLFGHGERTGNVDLVVLANNFSARGIPTGLDFSDLPRIAETVERLTGMPTYYRAPYSGEYVFTAFSGSHQDAIRKGMNRLDEAPDKFGVGWKVPYLHVDPTDLGRKYESLDPDQFPIRERRRGMGARAGIWPAAAACHAPGDWRGHPGVCR